jgi:CDP-glycerol glycerophosphotransferase (TagB/SpsB family)
MRNFRTQASRIFAGFIIDSLTRVKRKRVVFVTKSNVQFMGNLRIMLDALICDGGYEIAVFKRGNVDPDFCDLMQRSNVRVLSAYDFSTLRYIYSSEIVVLSHSARDAFISRRKRCRRVVNLWHGVALKRIEALMYPRGNGEAFNRRKRLIDRNSRIYDAMVASSKVDQLVIATCFGIAYNKVYPVGLPRFDYLNPDYEWPEDLLQHKMQLKALLAGRKFIVYAPTFRDHGVGLDDLLNEASVSQLKRFCVANNAVFGVRPHPTQSASLHLICDDESILDVSSARYPEPASVLSLVDALIVDYSSIWVDFLLRDLPILGYMPDFKTYNTKDRGFIYNFEQVFPGDIFQTWAEVLDDLTRIIQAGRAVDGSEKLKFAKALLLELSADNALVSQKCLDLFFSHNEEVR